MSIPCKFEHSILSHDEHALAGRGQTSGSVHLPMGTSRPPAVTPRDASNTAITRAFARCGKARNTSASLGSPTRFLQFGRIITSSDAEGAGALFRVSTLDLANLPRTPEGGVDFMRDFFGREIFLTVSGQLNVEAYCLALTKVYTFGPTFRAENSNHSRHLAEFWMIEPEIAFADLSDDATLAEQLLKFTFETLLNKSREDLAFFDERIEKGLVAKLQNIVSSEFVRMDYSEAISVLERAKDKFEFPVKWGMDLRSPSATSLRSTSSDP